jgi:hypothetical protein
LAGLVIVVGVCGIVSSARADPNFPPRKAGLWETKATMSNMMMNGQKMPGMPPGMVSVSCVDAESDLKLIQHAAQARGGCAPPVFGGGGNTFTVNVTCAVNGQTTSTAGTMTYVNDEHVVMDMQMSGTQMTGNMHLDSVWSGACPAGFAPGDYGMEMNGTFQREGNVLNMP